MVGARVREVTAWAAKGVLLTCSLSCLSGSVLVKLYLSYSTSISSVDGSWIDSDGWRNLMFWVDGEAWMAKGMLVMASAAMSMSIVRVFRGSVDIMREELIWKMLEWCAGGYAILMVRVQRYRGSRKLKRG